MKKSVLLNQLKEAVSREEYEKLMTDTISDISQYNRRTMLEIMDRISICTTFPMRTVC